MKIFKADRPLMVSRHDDETVSSFASRMAARNGAASLPDFCVDVGVNYLRLYSCYEEAHRQIVAAVDHRRAGLISITPCLIKRPFFRFGATRIHYRGLVKQQPKYCPECFREDFERGSPLGPFQRFPWLFASVRTCRKHGCLLLALPSVKSVGLEADYSRRVTDALGRRGERLGEVVSATSTPLEDYLIGRVLGRKVSEFLDRLDPWVVAETSEALGATIDFESTRHVRSLDTQELIDAGAGFDLLRQGQQVTIDAMDELRRNQPNPSLERVYFRKLLAWLEHRTPKVFEPIREVFRDYFVSTMPVRAGTKFLGKEVSEQKVFTLATAAQFAAVDKTKFERYLANRHAGIENAGGQPLPPGCVPASVAKDCPETKP